MPDKKYIEENITTLSSIEHIRKRVGMYIGRTGDGTFYDDGIYIIFKEVLDNSIDEYIMGHGKSIDINIDYGRGEITVRDYGRGIPLGKVAECVSQINTGGKFNDEVFKFSVGMNGVGIKAVNALSSYFEVSSCRDNRFSVAIFEKGKIVSHEQGKSIGVIPNGTFVRFIPDETIFKNYRLNEEHVLHRLQMYAYTNIGLTIRINGNNITSKNGLLDLLNSEVRCEEIYVPFHYKSDSLEILFTHTNRLDEEYYSFVNSQYTSLGGTHLSALKEGLLKAVNEYGKCGFSGDDVREGVVGIIALRIKEPMYNSQTKSKLDGNQDMRPGLVLQIKSAIEDMFHRAPDQAAKLIEKIESTRKLRSELRQIKKLTRSRAKNVVVRVPQLKDCKHHLSKATMKGLDTMIFITEGQSAGGSIIQCRDAKNQAIFTLKGKPLNVCDLKRDALYKNAEIYNLMKSLDIEESVENLRYQKVILATDADVDGLHIRNLLITLFVCFFKAVIDEGHLYILETPLFRVRNKRDTYYCYTEQERIHAINKCGRNPEITRFKGLGEISPGEFKDFIGDQMKLTPVDASNDLSVNETISFYMGRNTPDRKAYIMDNLIVDEKSM